MSLAGEAARRRDAIVQHQNDAERKRHRIDVLDESAKLVQQLIDELSKKGIAEMEAMLTAAVKAAFSDRDYRIRIEVNDRGKDKQAEFFLVQRDEEGIERDSSLDCNGDGLSAIIAFVTRVFFVVRFKKARILFDDETMKELSPRFTEGIAQFLQTVVEELGFVQVLITHARTQFLPYADRVYYVEEGGHVRETTAQEVLALGSGEDREEDPTMEGDRK